ncbi:amidohydrolase family protein [Microcella sp.]|uniref:amidohydrolase family protein n=1 Tax=Microcella sp. TaxID=1913979 RepID=UPI003F6F27A9
MIIDSHLHVWDLARAEYDWLTDALAPINRTLLIDDIAPSLDRLGIDGCVLVQAAENADDTDVMLDAAARNPRVRAVVAWAPLDRPTALQERLEWLHDQKVVPGIRNTIHTFPPEWVLRPEVDTGFGMLAAGDFSYDVVTSDPTALARLPGIGRRHPDLNLVIDHLGKPPIGGTAEERARWRTLLAEAAQNPRTHAKISGLYSATGDLAAWTPDLLRPFVTDALELFGAERLMFGGDWPVVELAGGYERAVDALTSLVAELSTTERAQIMGGTACRFYRLTDED